ncbi:MAG: methylenetetrahydrofolate--tRNA-(uracil(54)-C(5))-methyltransferase (FADH(2)-oxidizing) TrmFO [Clostridia bacterium]|nr:methylenetetrahydrofolate--tRNA-(uracil(54)-C(5))-methyltransferase (FADH(2)-oxidizing) TrmFO [Clostridia bacterium]
MQKRKTVNVIGGGLAGSEAAYYLAKRGYNVNLYDIKPNNFTPAHTSKLYGELVCSNSLKSNDVYGNACGLLKQEMRVMGSMVIDCADKTQVPAGNALAVDREQFASLITKNLKEQKNINFICEEVTQIDFSVPTIIATGPLTTSALCEHIKSFTGAFYFFDAAAPIVSGDSIDMENAFICDRYGEDGKGDYINCPMDKSTYELFYNELINAKRAHLHDFESAKVFEGCMPVEVMAQRGVDTLRFGPLKPAGLTDPKTGRWPYACLQLRKENTAGSAYNLVGFQTNLTFGEQKRVFSLFPALKNAEFIRYGVMHKNTFIDAPLSLDKYFRLKGDYPVYFAGQITGVEGYVESTVSGLMAAINLHFELSGLQPIDWDSRTVSGALACYISTPNSNFQPMNANFGILPPVTADKKNKELKKRLAAERALSVIEQISKRIKENE